MDTAALRNTTETHEQSFKRPCVNVHLLNRAEHLRRSASSHSLRLVWRNACAYFLIYSLKTLCTFLKLQSRWRTAKRSQDWLFSETVCQFFFCISSSVCQASSHHDLGWRPLCQAVKYVGEHLEGRERERERENVFIRHHPRLLALPFFSCWMPTVNKALIGRRRDAACRDQVRRLPSFAILRWKRRSSVCCAGASLCLHISFPL